MSGWKTIKKEKNMRMVNKKGEEMRVTLVTTGGGLVLLIFMVILFMCIVGAISGIILAEIFL